MLPDNHLAIFFSKKGLSMKIGGMEAMSKGEINATENMVLGIIDSYITFTKGKKKFWFPNRMIGPCVRIANRETISVIINSLIKRGFIIKTGTVLKKGTTYRTLETKWTRDGNPRIMVISDKDQSISYTDLSTFSKNGGKLK